MTVTITNTTNNPVLTTSGQSINPYSGVTVGDTAPLTTAETVTVTLSQSESNNPGNNFSFYPTNTNLGTITDPSGGGTFDPSTETFTETGLVAGDPNFATLLLKRLTYNAPTLSNGQALGTQAKITVTDNVVGLQGPTTASTTFADPVIVGVLTPSLISGTVANEPIASGNAIPPFATLELTNTGFSYNYYTTTLAPGGQFFTYNPVMNYSYSSKNTAIITVTDGTGPTDSDGLLTGPGLSKTGVGTYAISADYLYNLQYEIRELSFQTSTVPNGQTVNPSFELDVTDATSGLTSKDTTTSLLIIGPPLQPKPPSIAGTLGGQTVVQGNLINPFSSVTVSDANLNPVDRVTIRVTDSSGNATDANGAFGPGFLKIAPGIYTLENPVDPISVTKALHALSFTPTTLATTEFTISVTDVGVAQTATDSATTVIVVPPPNKPLVDNFLIHDETTGQAYSSAGEHYTGPVAGLTDDIILATPNNINVNTQIPNVFVKTGSGDDAIDVSAVNGNNVMDGGTGSNFLTGGSGTDTFFVDDRSAPADIWSTVNGFHAGDAATIWGVTPQDFSLTWVDGQGAASFTGLTLHATAPGKPIASLTLAGYTSADLSDGRLSVSFGTVDGNAYMYVHGNG